MGETGVARDLSDLTQQYLDVDASPESWDVEDYKAEHYRRAVEGVLTAAVIVWVVLIIVISEK